MRSDGKGLEIEIAQGDGDHKERDEAGVEQCRPVGLRPDEEAADDEKSHADEDERRENVDGEREQESEASVAEKIERVEISFQRVVNRHRVEGQGAVKDEDMHDAGEHPFVLERASLEDDLGTGIHQAAPEVAGPKLRLPPPEDLKTEVNRDDKGADGGQDDEREQDFFRARKHASSFLERNGYSPNHFIKSLFIAKRAGQDVRPDPPSHGGFDPSGQPDAEDEVGQPDFAPAEDPAGLADDLKAEAPRA